jgi:hypothetical protein
MALARCPARTRSDSSRLNSAAMARLTALKITATAASSPLNGSEQ